MLELYNKYPILVDAILYIIENNKSATLPYHNNDHLFNVFQYCHYIIEYDVNLKLNLSNKLELYIAALFHDFNHSGGKLKDSENIKNAIDAFHSFNINLNYNSNLNIDMVEYCIKATQYPLEDLELNIYGQIIRDADMAVVFSANSIFNLYSGLRSEMNMSVNDFIELENKFLNNMNFYTNYCKLLFKVSKNNRLEENKLLKKHDI